MPKKKGPSEHQIQSQILDWLKIKGIFHWRNNTGGFGGAHKGKKWFVRFGAVGSPDIFAVIEGHIYGIEVKAANGKLSEKQWDFANHLMQAGGSYARVTCIEDVSKLLILRAPERAFFARQKGNS